MKNISYPQLIIEFISVVFAVLLALGLNSYKQSLDAEEEAKVVKASILKELENNLQKVDSMLINNQAYANYLDSLIKLDREDVKGVSFGYNFELLTSAAWIIAQNNSATNQLDQKFLIDAAELYDTQIFFSEFAVDFFKGVSSHLLEQDERHPYNSAVSFYYSIHVMISSAEELKSGYQKFLKEHRVE